MIVYILIVFVALYATDPFIIISFRKFFYINILMRNYGRLI